MVKKLNRKALTPALFQNSAEAFHRGHVATARNCDRAARRRTFRHSSTLTFHCRQRDLGSGFGFHAGDALGKAGKLELQIAQLDGKHTVSTAGAFDLRPLG